MTKINNLVECVLPKPRPPAPIRTGLLRNSGATRLLMGLMGLLGCLTLPFLSTAQVTINTTQGSAGYDGGNSSSGGITFVINNTTSAPIILSEIGDWSGSSENGNTYSLYYSATDLTGQPPLTFLASNWTLVTSSTLSGVTGSMDVHTVLSGMTLQIPANTMYRFSLVTTGIRYYSGTGPGTCTPDSFTASGVKLYTGDYQINGQNVG